MVTNFVENYGFIYELSPINVTLNEFNKHIISYLKFLTCFKKCYTIF